jgi:hypothetical protein
MKIDPKDFRVPHGKKVKLTEWPTVVKPFCKSKEQYKELLEKHVEGLNSLQRLHYASGRYALLLIFQGMDAAGKDGAIRHVMSGVNPEACEVFSFKQPSAQDKRLTADIEAAQMQLHQTESEFLDLEGVLAFARKIFSRSARLWMESSLDQKQRLNSCFFRMECTPTEGNLKHPQVVHSSIR